MIRIVIMFLSAVGAITIGFFITILIIATVKILKEERRRHSSAELIGCGEHVFAVLTSIKDGKKEKIG